MRSRKGLCPGRKDFYPHVAKFMPVPVAAGVRKPGTYPEAVAEFGY